MSQHLTAQGFTVKQQLAFQSESRPPGAGPESCPAWCGLDGARDGGDGTSRGQLPTVDHHTPYDEDAALPGIVAAAPHPHPRPAALLSPQQRHRATPFMAAAAIRAQRPRLSVEW
jgi:hypothetical protein